MVAQTTNATNRALTGIKGFDTLTGGLPRGRTSLLIGGPGCGKTIFALETLVEGAQQWGEPGIFVAFEENTSQILPNAGSFGLRNGARSTASTNGSPRAASRASSRPSRRTPTRSSPRNTASSSSSRTAWSCGGIILAAPRDEKFVNAV